MSSSGRSIKRFEDPQLLTGKGTFVDDIKLPDMLYAYVLRSPHAHAHIVAINVSAALNLTGVVAVLIGEDLEEALRTVPSRPLADQAVAQAQGSGGDEVVAPDQPVLAVERVCFVGQPVAVVVAEERSTARDAADLITVEYEPIPPILDTLAALGAESALVHPDIGTNIGMRINREGGDLESAFAQADRVIRQRFEVQRLAPAPLEGRAVLAHHDPHEDFLTIWDSTQEPHQIRKHLAHLYNRPESSVRVVAPDVGGGFGEKGCVFPEEVSIPYLSLRLGRPIKWVEDRQENMLAFHGRGHTVDVEAAAKGDGTILGMRVRIVADLGAYAVTSTPSVPLLAGHRIAGPYKTPAMSVEVLGVMTNKPPTGAYRGAGGPESAFCMERTVELIAQDLGLDPVEVRRRNFIPSDAFPHQTPTGLVYDSGDYEQGLQRALELADYYSWREKAKQQSGPGEQLIGVGLATVVKASGGGGDMRTEVAQVRIEPSGQVITYTGVSPHGQGTETSFAQIVAGELGISPADVQVLHSDTALANEGGGTAASRGTVAGASAMYLVAQEARQKLSQIAAHLLSCSADDIDFQDKRVLNRNNPGQTLSFSEVVSAAYDEELLPPEVPPGLEFDGRFTLPGNPYGFGAHVVVVGVDPDTGVTEILKYVAVHDCGRIINPMIVDGQVHGAIAQGIGQALTEGMVYNEEGQPLTGSLLDYALPTANDIPNLIVDTIETPSPITPMGAKGIGELPTVAAPVAVTNAVLNALSGLGVRHIDTPLTPEKVWRAIQDAGRD